jgi:hypothetical protein
VRPAFLLRSRSSRKGICLSGLAMLVSSALPEEFAIYLNYVRKLGFEETPDYDFLRELFTKALKNTGEVEDGVYDWMLLNGGKGWEANSVRPSLPCELTLQRRADPIPFCLVLSSSQSASNLLAQASGAGDGRQHRSRTDRERERAERDRQRAAQAAVPGAMVAPSRSFLLPCPTFALPHRLQSIRPFANLPCYACLLQLLSPATPRPTTPAPERRPSANRHRLNRSMARLRLSSVASPLHRQYSRVSNNS